MTFASLGLHPELVRVVADEGYQEPTPVQRQAIPLVLAGRDVLAGAQTGTGKTAAFVLPILQRLHATRRPGPGGTPGPRTAVRVLVLTPTRELALQVEESVRVYGRHLAASSVAIYGGVGMGPQVGALRRGSEIVVATPGRLLDHVGQRTIDLSRVEILVLDEADRMLDMGFIRDIRKVIALLPERRQNLLFSATFSDDIRELASGILRDPAGVDVAPRNTAAETVEQVVIPVDRERKRDLLRELVALGRIDRALVFARTKHGANRLAEQLVRDGIGAAAIHGNKSQSQRVRALDDFKAGRVALLVATDIAARGIDIDALPHVVNYELPMVPEDYIHRIGRTGRAGVGGEAVSLVCVDEAPLLRDIQRLLGRQIPSETIAGFEPTKGIPAQPIQLRSAEHQRAGGGRGRRGGQTPAQGQGRARLHGEAPAAAPSRRHTAPATSASHAPHAASEPSDARRPSAPSAPNRHRHGGTPRPGGPRPGASIGQAVAPGRRPAAGDRRTGATPRAATGHPHTATHGHTQAQVPSGDRRIVAMPGERIRRLEAAHSTDRQSQSQHQSKSHSHSKGSAR